MRKNPELSRREILVLYLLAVGMTRGQVAHRLSISPYTVVSHIRRIRAKIGARDICQAVIYFWTGLRPPFEVCYE